MQSSVDVTDDSEIPFFLEAPIGSVVDVFNMIDCDNTSINVI